jgi:hypothetical protein
MTPTAPTDPYEQISRIRFLMSRVRWAIAVIDAWQRKRIMTKNPVRETIPIQVTPARASVQPIVPSPPDVFIEPGQADQVAGQTIVEVMTTDLQGELGLLHRHRQVTMRATPLANGSNRTRESLASRFTLDHPASASAPAPVVCEPQEGETPARVSLVGRAKIDETGLLRGSRGSGLILSFSGSASSIHALPAGTRKAINAWFRPKAGLNSSQPMGLQGHLTYPSRPCLPAFLVDASDRTSYIWISLIIVRP